MKIAKKVLFSLLGVVAVLLLAYFAARYGSRNSEEVVFNFNYINGIFLAVLQGLTEFLPISSSGHLKVVPTVLNIGDPGESLIAVLQLGSIVAVFIYFWGDLLDIAKGSLVAIQKKDWKSPKLKFAVGMIVGTIPIGILGLLMKFVFKDFYDGMRSLEMIGFASIVMGVLLWGSEKIGAHTKSYENVSFKDCFLIGCSQALALFPGVSRSGATLTTALFLKINRSDAARISFLMGIPAITLAGLVELKNVVSAPELNFPVLFVSLFVSTIISYLSIIWMIKFLQKHKTNCFVIYRIFFGIFILAWLLFVR